MATLQEVHVGAQTFQRFEPILGARWVAKATETADRLRRRLGDNVIWNVNSTAVGGGVAEMLPSLLSYARGHGLDARWVVMEGNPEFFRTTKRLHHALHGSPGDGAPLGRDDRATYEATTGRNVAALLERVKPGDVIILHDPQTAGMAPELLRCGAHVIWRCHIGHDRANRWVRMAWEFLQPYLVDVPGYVFSRREYAPPELDHRRVHVVQPSIDAFSPKNQALDPVTVRSILVHAGLLQGPMPDSCQLRFSRYDGSPGRVERPADVVRCGRPPAPDSAMILQISRWDPLKDMLGVMRGFVELARRPGVGPCDLVLAGPNVKAVTDDPEGPAVYTEVLDAWYRLPTEMRERIHLIMLPSEDVEENAAIVNALQRQATVVVQKSLHEGFGLTVTEAMWKGKPVIASRVGGIQDQIEHGATGVLLEDPRDTTAFADALQGLLADPGKLRAMGEAARESARTRFLGIRHLLDYGALMEALLRG